MPDPPPSPPDDAPARHAFNGDRAVASERAETARATPASDVPASTSRLVGFASSTVERVDAAFKASTVGLMTREDFVKRQDEIEGAMAREKAEKEEEARTRAEEVKAKRKRKRATKTSHKLSFGDEESDEVAGGEELVVNKGFGLGKNPNVNTEFLPDRAREEEELRERRAIEEEFLTKSRLERNEPVIITYSYYDGSRRAGGKIKCVKGDTVEAFLGKVRAELLADGERTVQRDMRHCDVSGMMYVKEDLIMLPDLTFHELITTKARGKSGPLFRFDVKDDVRLRGGADVEVENSHPGKVILRSWYDKNKSMFPANRWEVFERGKSYAEEGYRIK